MIGSIGKRGPIATVMIVATPQIALALPADEVTRLASAAPIGGTEILSLGTGLVVVILAIIVVGWLYSRMRGAGLRGNHLIDIVASHSLGPKERILLVDIAGKQLLVGMTSSQVQTLHVFEQPVVTAPQESGPHSPEPKGFAKRLRIALKDVAK